MEEVKMINSKPSKWYITSITFFIIVTVSTILLYFYNNSIVNQQEEIKNEISTIDKSIYTLENDKNLKIYNLIISNKSILDWYKQMNEVTKYILDLGKLEKMYDIKFVGFDLVKLNIKTNVFATTDENWNSYTKIKNFIKKYREDSSSLYDLDFITSFEWMDEIKFSASLAVKKEIKENK